MLIDRAKKYLGIAISNVICMYNPEVVLLAGPMVEDYPILVEDIEQITSEQMWSPLKHTFKLVRSTKIGRAHVSRLNSSHVAISYAVFCLKKKRKYYKHL